MGKEGHHGRDERHHVLDGSGFALVAFDAVEHCGIEGTEAELNVADAISGDDDTQAWEFLFEWGPKVAIGGTDGEFEEL